MYGFEEKILWFADTRIMVRKENGIPTQNHYQNVKSPTQVSV